MNRQRPVKLTGFAQNKSYRRISCRSDHKKYHGAGYTCKGHACNDSGFIEQKNKYGD